MATKRTVSEAETLEQYRVALDNAVNQPEIASTMAEFGYDEAMINEGKILLTKTRQAFDFNKKEDDETTESYSNFATSRENVTKAYTLHRKKAKVIFKNEPTTLSKLALTGSLPTSYINWLETVKKFYAVASTDTTIQSKLLRLKVTPEEITNAFGFISNLEETRAIYLREKEKAKMPQK